MKEQIIKIITDEIEGYTVPTEYELIDLVPDLYEKIDLAAERIVKLLNLHNVSGSLPEQQCKLIDSPDGFIIIPVTDCCKVGPITNENYCPNCGKKII